MKRFMIIVVLMTMTIGIVAKDIKTMVITPEPRMNCENCENKIKNALRFEKGVKDITTVLKAQTITVEYDADKTSETKIVKALSKAGYAPATSADNAATKVSTMPACDMAEKSCCKANPDATPTKNQCEGEKKSCCEGNKQCCKSDASCADTEAKQCPKSQCKAEKAKACTAEEKK